MRATLLTKITFSDISLGYRPLLPVIQKRVPVEGQATGADPAYEWFNCSLIRIGLLGSSPVTPKTAFSIKSLESYRQLRLKRPSLSLQAFGQALCATSGIQYTRGLRYRLSETFDAYLSILRGVDLLTSDALGRGDVDWRIKNSCPCCNHKVDGEPHLEYEQIFAIDGGSSLKRLKGAGSAETGIFTSSYYVTPENVDKFKDEAVKRSKRRGDRGRGGRVTDVEQDGAEVTEDIEGDAALEVGEETREVDDEGTEWITKNVQCEPGIENSSKLTLCVERWKANADDEKKGMFSCFDEAGIFTAVCRHGFLLAYCDMIQSGEL